MGMLHLPSGQYFGDAVAHGSVCGLRMVETVYRPGATLPWHRHQSPYLVVMLGGAMIEVAVGGQDHPCMRGWLVLDTGGEAHRDGVGPQGARCLNVELQPDWIRRHASPYGYSFAGEVIGAVGQLEMAFRRGGAGDELMAAAALHRLLDAASGCNPVRRQRQPAWMNATVELLHEASQCTCLTTLAGVAGVHPAHLCRTFLACFGCTIGEYARRVRADRALAMVVQSRRSLASIAADTGFTDQSHLTRELRHHFQCTPAALRDACRRGRGANPVQDA
jgi:AraC family transcriptional regulator